MNNSKHHPVFEPSFNHPHAIDPLFNLLRDTGKTIAYHPILRQLTGDINSAILLQQIMFYYVIMRRKPFYKFVEPSEHDHPLYKVGDSWTEELAFTKDEYNHAIKRIGTKVRCKQAEDILCDIMPQFGPSGDKRSKNKGRDILVNRNHLVVYWKKPDLTTHFLLNEKLLVNALQVLQHRAKAENPPQQVDNYSLLEVESLPMSGELPPSFSIEDSINNYREIAREDMQAVTAKPNLDRGEAKHSRFSGDSLNDGDHMTRIQQRVNCRAEDTIDRSDLESAPVEIPEQYSDLERFIARTLELKTRLDLRYRRRLRRPVTWSPDDSEEELVGLCPNELWDTDPLFPEWVEENLIEYLDGNYMLALGSLINQIASGKQYTNFYRWRDWQDDEEVESEPESEEKRLQGLVAAVEDAARQRRIQGLRFPGEDFDEYAPQRESETQDEGDNDEVLEWWQRPSLKDARLHAPHNIDDMPVTDEEDSRVFYEQFDFYSNHLVLKSGELHESTCFVS